MRNYKKNTVRLNERDLAKLIKRMIDESVEIVDIYKNEEGQQIQIRCKTEKDSEIIIYGGRTIMTDLQYDTACGKG